MTNPSVARYKRPRQATRHPAVGEELFEGLSLGHLNNSGGGAALESSPTAQLRHRYPWEGTGEGPRARGDRRRRRHARTEAAPLLHNLVFVGRLDARRNQQRRRFVLVGSRGL
ncbi:hypothetical protein MRX96_056929 [Rhipicephalus microplus]